MLTKKKKKKKWLLNFCSWFRNIIVENYLNYCNIMHITNLEFSNILSDKNFFKFNLCINDLNEVFQYGNINYIYNLFLLIYN